LNSNIISNNRISNNITLRQLRAFLAIANEQSITRAADKIHLTPSALSMLIRSLETELAVRLFERTTRKLELTSNGKEFLPTAEKVFELLNQAMEKIRDSEASRAGSFKVATSPLLASEVMPQVIASFKARFPGIEVSLIDVPVDAIADAVRQRTADFGICTAPDQDSSTLIDLAIEEVYKDKLMLAVHKDHEFAERSTIAWGELAKENLVMLKVGSGLRRLAEQGLAASKTSVKPAYEVGHVATAVGMVEAGLGLAPLPSYTLARSTTKAFTAIALVDPLIERDIVMISHQQRPLSDASRAFVQHFTSNINDPYDSDRL
jgi:LysR family transcriptional regulator, carnitine catabolism transcriptional activator